jgi:hypothetical protein
LSTNFSPGFSDSFSGMRGVLACMDCDHIAAGLTKGCRFAVYRSRVVKHKSL